MYQLINFNIPIHLKKLFDKIVRFKRVSRTSVLNTMIEDYCRKEMILITEDGRVNELICNIEKRNPSKQQQSPPRWEDSYGTDDVTQYNGLRL